MNLEEFLKITAMEYMGGLYKTRQDIRIPCYMKDGEYHSTQANIGIITVDPKLIGEICGRFYTHLELAGGLSDKDLRVMGLEKKDYDDVYGYVPVEAVEKFINNHGGIDSDMIDRFKMIKELYK